MCKQECAAIRRISSTQRHSLHGHIAVRRKTNEGKRGIAISKGEISERADEKSGDDEAVTKEDYSRHCHFLIHSD